MSPRKGFFMSSYMKPLKKKLRFEVNLVEHCNLNCIGCDHFSPVAEEGFTDVDKYERDLIRLSELFGDDVSSITLVGGEPLMHPQLIEFIKRSRRHFPKTGLGLFTNGILLTRMPAQFWEACRDEKVVIIITNYPIKIDNDKIRQLTGEYGIQLDYSWENKLKTMHKLVLDPEGKGDVDYNFKKCYRSNSCIFLQDGRLYTCTVAPTAHHLNKHFDQKLEMSEKDSIDIYQAQSANEILEFLRRPIPFCRYCDMHTKIKGITWKQSDKKLTEWYLTDEEKKKRDFWRKVRGIFGRK
ncbi:radical SAM protein [Deltaproteobacteria bacterium Smac51]|nr:radical SAM protein [Deltaproteobacteria bacterium Smac51]